MQRKIFIRIIYFFFVLLVLSGCSCFNNPPELESVEKLYIENKDVMQNIVDYLIDTGYENVHIMNTEGCMLADLEEKQIEDDSVLSAINQLLNCSDFKDISKRGNTISFLCWEGFSDVGCGVAYSINNADLPEILFESTLISLSDEGWFYYAYDYNSWRTKTAMEPN